MIESRSRQHRILITGGSGFIGSHLRDRLDGFWDGEVLAPSHGTLDLSDAQGTENYLRVARPTSVVHLAGCLDRSETADAKSRQWRDTFIAGVNLLNAVEAADVKHLVISGSLEELGPQSGVLTPDSQSQPHTTYGLCKQLLLESCRFLVRRHRVRVDWFRPTTVFGPGQVGPMLIPSAFKAGYMGEPAGFTSGEQERDFLYVEDLVDWILCALQAPIEADAAQLHVHHVGSSSPVPVREVLGYIQEHSGVQLNIGAVQRRHLEPPLQTVPLFTSDEPGLNAWKPNTRWDEGLRKTAIWWRDYAEKARKIDLESHSDQSSHVIDVTEVSSHHR